MSDVSHDPMLRSLAGLPRAVPEGVHSAAVRARCHAALARKRRRQEAAGAHGGVNRALEIAAAAAFGLVYASVVIREALMLYVAG